MQIPSTTPVVTPDIGVIVRNGGPFDRLYGHLPYAPVDPASLVSAPEGFAVGQPCLIQPAVRPDLEHMIAAAAKAGLGETLHGVSCYRSLAHQERVFCDRHGRSGECVNAKERSVSVAPPGHSEHATGYAIDFGERPEHGCPDVDPCLADTPIGRWLLAHANEFGFELSFPRDNIQGVTWEPWHWRWVGISADEPGAAAARALFATARANFPARPGIPGLVLRVMEQPPVPTPGGGEISPQTEPPPAPAG